MIRRYRRMRDGGAEFGPGLVVRGTHDALGGVVATAGALAAFFLPVLFFGAVAGLEMAGNGTRRPGHFGGARRARRPGAVPGFRDQTR
ncbi:hypothetical protein ILP97_01615 [Amycolatopsis sp. H6(2020)]|nr:hypothetical protein [Amycolatopsis sp. H6(2020)]